MTFSSEYPLISIFIPVYNGSAYLNRCLDSIVNQTYNNLQIICLDDSSTDNSYSIIAGYARNDSRILLLSKTNGGNVPISWNYVKPYLKGEYISYMSQDDWMSRDNIEKNFSIMINTNADIVVPDLIDILDKNKIYKFIGLNGNRNISLTGIEAFIYSLNWKIHGFFLCKTDLIIDEYFNEENFNSDEYITRKCFLKSKLVVFSDGIFYHNNSNPNSITKKFEFRTLTALNTDIEIIKLIIESKIGNFYKISYSIKSIFRFQYYLIKWWLLPIKDADLKLKARNIFLNHFHFIIKTYFNYD